MDYLKEIAVDIRLSIAKSQVKEVCLQRNVQKFAADRRLSIIENSHNLTHFMLMKQHNCYHNIIGRVRISK